MARRILRDDQWARIQDLLPGKASDCGVTAKDNRRFLEAVLWIRRTGAPWRDLSPELGNWHTTFTRFSRWAKKGVWERLFQSLSQDRDLEAVMLDSTVMRAHQHDAGAKKTGPTSSGPLSWRIQHQDPQPRRCARQPPRLHAHRRRTRRHHPSPGVARKSERVGRGNRRQGL